MRIWSLSCCAHAAVLAVVSVQTLMGHELGLNSIWDVPWAPGAAGCSSSGNGSNGNGKHSNGKGSLKAVQPTNGSSSSSGLGGNGKSASSSDAGAAAAAAASGGSSNGHQSNGGEQGASTSPDEQDKPVPAQEGCEFTTWKFRSNGVAKRTIDYVWYTGAQLSPVSRWRMLSEAEIGPAGLPNTVYPSDHMAVTCQFGWIEE